MSKVIEYQFNKVRSFRTNLVQVKTLQKLKTKYKIDVSHFIREAISEKINRDYLDLKEKIKKSDLPF